MSDFVETPERLKTYNTENIEFKEKARKLVIKNLGFEPNLKASLGIELLIRKLIKNVETGKISKKDFKECLEVFCNAIRGMIRRRVPEQVYLLEKKRPSVPYLYLGLGFLSLCLLGCLVFFLLG
ncbi:hypothetical protein [uncultured Kordia sp.]|uniref:hypothetical protein n=1 Tax=uncultured Kordia sp. TaxID=507699 RepID=UPI00262C5FC8|nr:hypothetical protein [uncultured Kordia sp.]